MQSDQPVTDRRLRLLNRAIEANPAAGVNYVFRGEYWLEQGQTQAAIADFEQAVRLEQQALEQSGWGYVEQSLIDRAEQGLRLARSASY